MCIRDRCRDVVSQEYLIDVVCQVFPDEFHLGTLNQLLDTTLKLNPDVSINKVILSLIARLNGYYDRQDDHDSMIENLKRLQLGGQLDKGDAENKSDKENDSGEKDDGYNSASEWRFDLFFFFWRYLTNLIEERPDLPLHEIIPLVHSVLLLSLKWYPTNPVSYTHLDVYKRQIQFCYSYAYF